MKTNLEKGERLLDRMLGAGIELEHDCDGALACASCLVVVREGAQALGPASADELDLLDRADATMPGARLACQSDGARLCTYLELAYAASAGQAIVSGRWLGDRVGDNTVLRTNGTISDDFDQEENIAGGGASIGGYYCCVDGADID